MHATAKTTLTWDASVGDMQVSFEFTQTRSCALEFGVRYADLTPATTRTAAVDKAQHVRLAAEMTHNIDFDAPTEFHASVTGDVDNDHLELSIGAAVVVAAASGGVRGRTANGGGGGVDVVVLIARRSERFGVTVIAGNYFVVGGPRTS